MENLNHADIMESLMSKHDVLLPLIKEKPIHYVDMPVHNNIGDLLIMLGTLAFFERNNVNIKTKSAHFNFSESWIDQGDVIVFHGGGNLGDIYAAPQKLREHIIEKFKHNTIVIMPQSIHFSEKSNYEKCCDIFSKHSDLHIVVRDEPSQALAQKMSSNVYLLPDMAHHLWKGNTVLTRPNQKLALVRSDGEINQDFKFDAGQFDTITDWPELVGYRTKVLNLYCRILKVMHALKLDTKLNKLFMGVFERYAKYLVADATKLYNSHNFVLTDRLHGHILSCLLNIEHSASDNVYGKTSRYMGSWTGSSSLIKK